MGKKSETPIIRLTDKHKELLLRSAVEIPPLTWSVPRFTFDPSPFYVQHPSLKDNVEVDALAQRQAFESFLAAPSKPCTYVCTSEPDGVKAQLFAAYLLVHYLSTVRNARPLWVRAHIDKSNVVRNEIPYSFLVVSGLYPTMTPSRIEKVKNLLDFYEGIPRIIIGSGEDPIALGMGRLYVKPTHLFYSNSRFFKRTTEII